MGSRAEALSDWSVTGCDVLIVGRDAEAIVRFLDSLPPDEVVPGGEMPVPQEIGRAHV